MTANGDVRTSPLTAEEIHEFWNKGFLRPGRVFTDDQVEVFRKALERGRTVRFEMVPELVHNKLKPGYEGDDAFQCLGCAVMFGTERALEDTVAFEQFGLCVFVAGHSCQAVA